MSPPSHLTNDVVGRTRGPVFLDGDTAGPSCRGPMFPDGAIAGPNYQHGLRLIGTVGF